MSFVPCVDLSAADCFRHDSLIPRMTATLASTSNTTILCLAGDLLSRAMADPSYTLPGITSDSVSSLHNRAYSASITSLPSLTGVSHTRAQLLEDLGMRGLAEANFPSQAIERSVRIAYVVRQSSSRRIAPLAKHISALIDSFTT